MLNNPIDHDELILQMLAADDEQAIRILFDQHHALLSAVVYEHVEDRKTTEDIIQELFIYLWVKRHSLKFRKPLTFFLLRAVMNRIRNHKRQRWRRREVIVTDFLRAEHGNSTRAPDSELHVRDMRQLWAVAKRKMSPRVRVTYILSRKKKMSYPEIAAQLGISVKAVEKNISSALTILREVFGPYLHPILLLATLY